MAKAFDGVKDPQEIRDFGVDWTPDLGAKTILASVWSIVTGSVVIDAQSFTDKQTVVRLSGGTLNEKVSLLNHITLSSGEEYEMTCTLKIKAR